MTAPRVISRKEAGLALPKKFSGWMKIPAPRVWVHHTVTEQFLGREAEGMRYLQKIAFDRGFYDISYSFAIFNSGVIGEGRGWGVVGAHTQGYNTTSHGIVYVGNFENDHPTTAASDAAKWLIDEGIRLGKIGSPRDKRPDGGHRDVAKTACPGKNVYATIPHLRFPWVDSEEEEVAPRNIVHVNHPKADGSFETNMYFDDGVTLKHIISPQEFWEAVAHGYKHVGELHLVHALERRRLLRIDGNLPPHASGWRVIGDM